MYNTRFLRPSQRELRNDLRILGGAPSWYRDLSHADLCLLFTLSFLVGQSHLGTVFHMEVGEAVSFLMPEACGQGEHS